MEKTCSKCGSAFNCGNESPGCWCEQVQLDQRILDLLKENYANCLCPNCLKSFELQPSTDTSSAR
ncbi:MAG: cysteine-rich CWC family protein [Flavisolibacter sp.]